MAEVGTSARSGASTGREFPAFPQERQLIGENPARWLDWDFLDNEHARRLARSRIRVLEDVQTCAVYLRVERDLERGEDDGPRDRVVEWIEERRDECLQEDRHDFDEWLAAQPKADPEPVESVCRFVEQDGDDVVVRDPAERDKGSRRDTRISRGETA